MNYYARYVRNILRRGKRAEPRGLSVDFLINQTFATFTGWTYRRPHDNPLIGFMEGLQFIAGMGDVNQIERVAPKAALQMFSGQSLYGPRANHQLIDVVEELNADRYSRRAVITLPDREEPLAERPCTTSLQYQIVDGLLNTTVTMRSSDAVYGLPYDLIQFSMMSQVIACCTKTTVDKMVINVGNAHIYDDTKHLATNFTLWDFNLPDISDDPIVWMQWAKDEMELLSMEHVVNDYHFKKSNAERALV